MRAGKQVYQGSAEQSDRRIVRFLFENPGETGRIQRVWEKCTYLGQIKDNKKYGGVIIVVKYEEGNVNYSLAYDEDMNLVSFTM